MPEDLPQVVMPECETRKVLKGQKMLVTGANSGIGKAIAIALCRAGADVIINYRSGDEEYAEGGRRSHALRLLVEWPSGHSSRMCRRKMKCS